MKLTLVRAICLAVAAALILCLSGCRGVIPDNPMQTQPPVLISENTEPPPPTNPSEPRSVGELYGSYLTMYIGKTPIEERETTFMRVFETYRDVEEYYDSTVSDYLYGMRFTIAMASFTDQFLAENDVMIVSINEPSSYVNHTAGPITVTDDGVSVNIIRHIPENAPLKDTQYHLIFIAPNGGFSGLESKELQVNVFELIDRDIISAFDGERFRRYYPEFWNFCYRADSLTDDPEITVGTISNYEELVLFYETYKETFDLDSYFRRYIGTLYNWEICERYVLIVTIIPCADTTEPLTSEFFVNNLEIFMTIDSNQPQSGERPAACYLLLTAAEKSDLQGVKLNSVNISF